MKTEPMFPTDLTDEERTAGFRLVETRLPGIDYEYVGGVNSTTVVAVLPLAPSFRLIKMRDLQLHPSDPGIGYQLQSFGFDAPPLLPHHAPPQWQSMWDGLPSTIELARRRFQTEKLNPHWRVASPPEEATVEMP